MAVAELDPKQDPAEPANGRGDGWNPTHLAWHMGEWKDAEIIWESSEGSISWCRKVRVLAQNGSGFVTFHVYNPDYLRPLA
jgi:hypothetical protein